MPYQIRNPRSEIRNGQLFGMICALVLGKSLPEISTNTARKLRHPMVITRATKRYLWFFSRDKSLR
jgi:hypothetical protein